MSRLGYVSILGVGAEIQYASFLPAHEQDEFRYFPESEAGKYTFPQGETCFSQGDGFTEEDCCRTGLDTDFNILGNEECWISPFTFEGCCLNYNTCDGVAFRQFRDLMPKYIDKVGTEEEHKIADKLLVKSVFVRTHAIKSCPEVGFLAGWLGSINHLSPGALDNLHRISSERLFDFSSGGNGWMSAITHWQWNQWGMWESVSHLAGVHGYNESFTDGVGAFREPLRMLHNNVNAPGRDKIVPRMHKSGFDADVMHMVSDYAAAVSKTTDDLVLTSSFATPHVLHSLSGPFQMLSPFNSIGEQTEQERYYASNVAYLNGERRKIFTKFDMDGILIVLFDMFLGVGDWPFYVEIGTQSGEECNTRFFRMTRGWNGVMFDQQYENPYIRLRRLHVTPDNVIAAVDREGVPDQIDLLSIDIDGHDYHLFKKLVSRVNARVIIVEIVGDHYGDPDFDFENLEYSVQEYNASSRYAFASTRALTELAAEHGYSPVSVVRDDIVFVKNEELEKVRNRTGVRFLTELPELLYLESRYVRREKAAEAVGYKMSAVERQHAVRKDFDEFKKYGFHAPDLPAVFQFAS